MRVGLPQLQRQLSARDPGKIEQIFDQAHLKFEITADHFQSLLDVWPEVGLFCNRAGPVQHRCERRAQLLA